MVYVLYHIIIVILDDVYWSKNHKLFKSDLQLYEKAYINFCILYNFRQEKQIYY